ncbi:hypothetical protein CABS01_16269 [Colletotrichum abscissum]|uniref:BTB domain-containing protein n=1 Tax=Colletotrichum abscissum TaxID=1671311 RepID=A0A9Q0AXU8_9PEZI|nr:uncharacterized protein CABS01_16269 [Colletotrichum abscissum]KAI3531717.1 hypothetical protein CABS02_14082 [Colletotrichum abscissum]KAK1472538.1 hypothetical protein CABS01_16269 [Colletotrichum abscissum]
MVRQRSRSDVASPTSPKIRRLSNALRKISSISSAKDDGSRSSSTRLGDFEFGGGDPIDRGPVSSRGSSSAGGGYGSGTVNESDVQLRQIQQLTQRVGSTLASKDADAAYKEYAKVKDHVALCRALLRKSTPATGPPGQATGAATAAWAEGGRGPSRESSLEVPQSPASILTRSSFSGRSLSEVTTGQSAGSRPMREICLSAVRDWKGCIGSLVEALELSLSETYRSYEPDATPSMVKSLFQDRVFRAAAIQQMRRASIIKTFSPSPDFFPLYDIRFRNHDRVKQDLVEVTRVLQLGESGVTDERPVKELAVAPRGDAVLEFANIGAENGAEAEAEALPVLRYRVSSFLLAETSPVFERMFTEHAHIEVHDDEDLTDQLAPPPTAYICPDGTEAKLYRMPQREGDREQALTILLHAAHMHNDKVPREVTFEQLVAIAEVCLRYRCTSPLELFVEHRWLPQWIHRGSEAMPRGWLLISYAFGFRQLFTRMSKTVILNLVDEDELEGMHVAWPRRIREKIWGVRGAKMAQVEECCVSTIREYLRPPCRAVPPPGSDSSSVEVASTPATNTSANPALMFTSTPRCPKGSHSCDATNLGWLMLVYGELELLPTIMNSSVLGHLAAGSQQQQYSPPRRSLAQLVDLLRTIASPPLAVHRGGVCDPAPAFRAAINDIYNSVSGLTLHDVSGRAHGWGLSQHRSTQPQAVLHRGLRSFSDGKKVDLQLEQQGIQELLEQERGQKQDQEQGKVLERSDAVRLLILERCVESVEDLRAAAMVDRRFYETFRENEGVLMGRFVGDARLRTLMKLTSMDVVAAGENKVPKGDADAMKAGAEAVQHVVSDDGLDGRLVRTQDETVTDVLLAVPSSPGPGRGGGGGGGGDVSAFDESSEDEGEVLSEDEARRILWPPEVMVSPAQETSSSSPRRLQLEPLEPGSGSDIMTEKGVMREKFRTSDAAFVEEKMLLEGEDKHLRDERDRRIGLLPGDG